MAMAGGTYRSESAMAVGLFYRPKENILVSLSSTIGNGHNMVGAGISFALDKIQKPAVAPEQNEQIQKLQAENAEIKAELAELKAAIKSMKETK